MTWFWANDALDAGEICEQEVVPIPEGVSPRMFYETVAIPAGVRLLKYALKDLINGHVRRRPQNELAATYEPPWMKSK